MMQSANAYHGRKGEWNNTSVQVILDLYLKSDLYFGTSRLSIGYNVSKSDIKIQFLVTLKQVKN